MNLCSDGHPEICYEVNPCPLCEAQIDAKQNNEMLQGEIDKLVNELNELKREKNHD